MAKRKANKGSEGRDAAVRGANLLIAPAVLERYSNPPADNPTWKGLGAADKIALPDGGTIGLGAAMRELGAVSLGEEVPAMPAEVAKNPPKPAEDASAAEQARYKALREAQMAVKRDWRAANWRRFETEAQNVLAEVGIAVCWRGKRVYLYPADSPEARDTGSSGQTSATAKASFRAAFGA